MSRGYLKASDSKVKLTAFSSSSFLLSSSPAPNPCPCPSYIIPPHEAITSYSAGKVNKRSLQKPKLGSKQHLREQTSNSLRELITDLYVSFCWFSVLSIGKTLQPHLVNFLKQQVLYCQVSFMNNQSPMGEDHPFLAWEWRAFVFTFDGSGMSDTLEEMTVHQLNLKDVTVSSARHR